MDVRGQLHAPDSLPPGTLRTGDWVGPQSPSGRGHVEKKGKLIMERNKLCIIKPIMFFYISNSTDHFFNITRYYCYCVLRKLQKWS
jgi:hypothetical protein